MTPQEAMYAANGDPQTITLYPTGKRPVQFFGWLVCYRSSVDPNNPVQTNAVMVYLTVDGTLIVQKYVYDPKYTSLSAGRLVKLVGTTKSWVDGLLHVLMNGYGSMPLAEYRAFLAACELLQMSPCETII